MGKVVTLTPLQGTHYLRMANNAVFPEKLGDHTFSHSQRTTFNKEIRQLFKKLRDTSVVMKEEKRLYFGKREFWNRIELRPSVASQIEEMAPAADRDSVKYEIKKEHMETGSEVELTGTARDGLFRLMLLNVHPDSRYCLAPGSQEDLIWGVAEQIHAVKALETAIGQDKNDTVGVKYEDEDQEAKKPDLKLVEDKNPL